MAGIDSQLIKDFCRNLSEEVANIYPQFCLYFIVFENGTRAIEINKLLPMLNNHPAFEEAVKLLRFKSAALEHSTFVGIAEGNEKSKFGFKKIQKNLAFFCLNIDDHNTEEDLIFTVYKLISQFFDLLNENNENIAKEDGKSINISSGLSNVRTNLRADIFNVLYMAQDGEKSASHQRAEIRALQVLNPTSGERAEEFAFPIALDVTDYAIKKEIKDHKHDVLKAYKIAERIVNSFDNDSLKIWSQFVHPCQILAWSGYSPSQILGSATILSPNPYIKATGHLLTEITGINSCDERQLPKGYNPFIDDEINKIRHKRSIEETFEMTLIHSMEIESHLPFLRVANNQNEALLKGHISGWCAQALQAAARAYMGAKSLGVPPHQAARLEFRTYSNNDTWKPLLQLAQYVIELCRNGTEAKTLSALANWCNMHHELKFVAASLGMTISDPSYNVKIKAAVEMPHIAPLAPATELIRSLSIRKDVEYIPVPAMGLGFGDNGGGGNIQQPPKTSSDIEILLED